MKLLKCSMSKSEEKTRKHWLLSTVSLLVLYPLALFAFFAVMSERINIPEDALIEPLAYSIAGVFSLWIIWHCAYKKYGTKLLTWWLIVSPIKTLASIVECLKESCNWLTMSLVVIDIGVFVWWFFVSLKMKSVNKSIQERAFPKKAVLQGS